MTRITQIKKTLLAFEDEATGATYLTTTISYEGKLWLVPEWLENPKEGWSAPARIVCMDGLAYQSVEGADYQYVLNNPIPRLVYDGQVHWYKGRKYVVVEQPDIQIQVGRA